MIGVLVSYTITAQTYLLETFDTAIPATWTTVDNSGGGNWEWQDNNGQGIALLDSDGFGNDNQAEDADLITPTIDCSGAANVYVSVKGFFRQYNASVGTMSVSGDDGTTWTSVATVNTSNGDDIIVDVSAVAANQSTVKVKFNYVGSYDYYWVLDEVKVYTPENENATMLSIDNGVYVGLNDGPISFTGEMQNSGLNAITSFDINYSVGGGAVVSNTITGVNIPFGGTYTYTHPDAWTPVLGSQMVEVSVGNVNGMVDGDLSDNAVSKEFSIYDVSVQRVPLYEVLTSSTCGPCTPGNINFHSIVDTKEEGTFTAIKYQQDFPGTGDPYATTESVNRRNFYSVNSIPRMEIDGGWDQNATSFTEALHTESLAKPSFMTLDATYHVDVATKTVSVKVSGEAIQAYPAGSYKLHVAVLEKLTTSNVKTNGETEFENVMKKMLPNDNGTDIAAIPSGFTIDESFEYTFNGEYRLPSDGQAANRINHTTEHSVEGFDDLEVVVFVQENNTLEVLQSAYAKIDSDNDSFSDEEEIAAGSDPNDEVSNPNNVSIKDVETVKAFNVFPNPATDRFKVEIETVNNETVNVELINVLGETISTISTKNIAEFKTANFSKGIYLVKVVSKEKVLATSTVVLK